MCVPLDSTRLIGCSLCVCVCVAFRYPPSSRQASQEEGNEWLRSHSTGGLQDTGSQSPLSPPPCSNTGKHHYSSLGESRGTHTHTHTGERSCDL